MSLFNTISLSPMQSGRLQTALDRQYRFDGVVKTLRSHIEELAAAGKLEFSEGDGMIDYSRTHFNRRLIRRAGRLYRPPQGQAIFLPEWVGGSEAGVRCDQALMSAAFFSATISAR